MRVADGARETNMMTEVLTTPAEFNEVPDRHSPAVVRLNREAPSGVVYLTEASAIRLTTCFANCLIKIARATRLPSRAGYWRARPIRRAGLS